MRSILIVEDEQTLRDGYELILSTEPYKVFVAANGEEALEQCRTREFDLILLDLMMPRMDGVTFLQERIKSGLTSSKVIIMSNLSSGDELSRALALGAFRSVVKADMSPRQLLAMVRYELAGA